MRIAQRRLPGGAGLARALVQRAAKVTLDWDARQKSRLDAEDDQGHRFAIVLPRGTVLRVGDVLLCDDGSLVAVHAANQAVMQVRVSPARREATHSDSERKPSSPRAEVSQGVGARMTLVHAAYHLGNRHVPLDVQPNHVAFEPDPVLADMLRGMGFDLQLAQAPFEPQGGAYHAHAAGGHAHQQSGDNHQHGDESHHHH